MNAGDIRHKVRCALEIAAESRITPETDIEAFIETQLPFRTRGTYGTNTSCVEIRNGDDFVLCDAGTGLRDFGTHLLSTSSGDSPKDFHILISHLHWDHIQGFPFFFPIYAAGNSVTIYGCHEKIRDAFLLQQSAQLFPVDFRDLGADIRFELLTPGETYDIEGFRVTTKEQRHPGASYGYRLERGGKAVVYSTDSEHKSESDEDFPDFVRFFDRADLLIFDAQYSFADVCTIKEDWGHANNLIGVELAQKAGVKHLCLYHQEPASTDEELDSVLRDTEKLALVYEESGSLRVSIAWDGMTLEV